MKCICQLLERVCGLSSPAVHLFLDDRRRFQSKLAAGAAQESGVGNYRDDRLWAGHERSHEAQPPLSHLRICLSDFPRP